MTDEWKRCLTLIRTWNPFEISPPWVTRTFFPTWNLRQIETKCWGAKTIFTIFHNERAVYCVERFRKIHKREMDAASALLQKPGSKYHINCASLSVQAGLRFGHNDVGNVSKVVQYNVARTFPATDRRWAQYSQRFPLLRKEARNPYLCNEKTGDGATLDSQSQCLRTSAGIKSGPEALLFFNLFTTSLTSRRLEVTSSAGTVGSCGVSGVFLVKQILQVFRPFGEDCLLIIDERVSIILGCIACCIKSQTC